MRRSISSRRNGTFGEPLDGAALLDGVEKIHAVEVSRVWQDWPLECPLLELRSTRKTSDHRWIESLGTLLPSSRMQEQFQQKGLWGRRDRRDAPSFLRALDPHLPVVFSAPIAVPRLSQFDTGELSASPRRPSCSARCRRGVPPRRESRWTTPGWSGRRARAGPPRARRRRTWGAGDCH